MDQWLAGQGRRRGFVVAAQTMFDLSLEWYAGRMGSDWEPPSAADAEAIFARHGLTGPFWRLT
ncbi:MAG: hypothetical protein WAL25_09135 [Acidimicrobiia bacterium]